VRSIRVLHCPDSVAGNAQGLARAERAIGLDSWAAAFHKNAYGVACDEIVFDKRDNFRQREIKRWRFLLKAMTQFDITHFNFGGSILDHIVSDTRSQAIWMYARFLELRDLPLLRMVGKGIFVTFQGDDARQGDFCARNFDICAATEVEPGYYSPETDAHKRIRIAKFAKYCDRIFALNPDLLHVLPPQSRFLPYAHVDPREWNNVGSKGSQSHVPLIVHAPTHRGVKGTRYILDAISRLKREGVPLRFALIEKLPFREARRIYEQADLLVDQLLIGWYGGVAVEFMALGKPVICYVREADLKFIPSEMRAELPIINATPSTIYDVLKKWLTTRKSELPDVGRRSRLFMERWHDPLKIATRLKFEYESVMMSKRMRDSAMLRSGKRAS